MSRTILVTGFESFEDVKLNPSWQVARALDGWTCDGYQVVAVKLPVAFWASMDLLRTKLKELDPVLVLSLGLARGLPHVALERVALNLDDARIPDNAGQQPMDRPIIESGPMAYLSSLPVKDILQNMHREGIPAGLSLSAGTYVCNHVFYGLCHIRATEFPQTRVGFIHVPLLPEQAVEFRGEPSMALEMQVKAIRVAIRTSLLLCNSNS